MITLRANLVLSGALLQSRRNIKRSAQIICYQEVPAPLLDQAYLSKYSFNVRQKSTNASQNSSLLKKMETEQTQLTLGQKVKRTAESTFYFGVVVCGFGVAGVIIYTILHELFSSKSPTSVYSEALKLCRKNHQVVDAIGEPIKGYGETTSRGRRRYANHKEYVKDNVKHMKLQFYLQGSRRKGTVTVEVKENNRGKYDYRYVFVTLDGYPPKTLAIVDNRHLDEVVQQ